jgi:hypothetical protein
MVQAHGRAAAVARRMAANSEPLFHRGHTLELAISLPMA